MSTTLTIKGQVTIPKQIRDALGLHPGMPVDFAVNQDGEVVIHKAEGSAKRKPDMTAKPDMTSRPNRGLGSLLKRNALS